MRGSELYGGTGICLGGEAGRCDWDRGILGSVKINQAADPSPCETIVT
jgi:hypothetical protein